jgi:hypothetical protein
MHVIIYARDKTYSRPGYISQGQERQWQTRVFNMITKLLRGLKYSSPNASNEASRFDQ